MSSFVVIYPAYESASVSSRQHGSLLSRYCQNETASECSLKVIIIAKSFIFVFRDPQNRHPECANLKSVNRRVTSSNLARGAKILRSVTDAVLQTVESLEGFFLPGRYSARHFRRTLAPRACSPGEYLVRAYRDS